MQYIAILLQYIAIILCGGSLVVGSLEYCNSIEWEGSYNTIRLFTALIKQKWCFLWKKLVSSIIFESVSSDQLATNHLGGCALVLPSHSIKFPHSFTHRSIKALFQVSNSWDGCVIFIHGSYWEVHGRFMKMTDFELESVIAPQVVGLRWTA